MGSRTTHLVFASIVAPGASNAEGRRRFGSDCVNTLEAQLRILSLGVQVLVVCGGSAGAASKRVANGHLGDRRATATTAEQRRRRVAEVQCCQEEIAYSRALSTMGRRAAGGGIYRSRINADKENAMDKEESG